MTGLVDTQHPERSRAATWLRRSAFAVGLLLFVGVVAWAGFNISHSKPPGRQVAKIMLLPDQPPPPPPPPPPEKPKLEPRDQMKQQAEKPKRETPPEPQQLKMEGQAGEGPSPFASGEVKNDYIGGDIGNGQRFSAYVGRVAQFIQDEISRRKLKVTNARVFLWLTPDGTVERYEVEGAGGDVERQLRTAMSSIHLPEAPPQDMPMPMGLEISER